MKRFVSVVVAAATALTLSTGVAAAQDGSSMKGGDEFTTYGKGSSKISDDELGGYAIIALLQEEANAGDGFTSSVSNGVYEDAKIADSTAKILLKNDVSNGWKLGTTLDIIYYSVGGISLLLALGIAAVQAGVVPGM